MPLYRIRRMWTALLIVGVPTSVAGVVWALFLGARPSTGLLAGAYLLIVIAGRAHSAEKERRTRPVRMQRVNEQLHRVRSTLPGVHAHGADCPVVQLRPSRTPELQPQATHSLALQNQAVQSVAGSSR